MNDGTPIRPARNVELGASGEEFQNIHEFVRKARARLNQNAWDYIVGAAETERHDGELRFPGDLDLRDLPERVVQVSGLSRLYTLISGQKTRHGILELRFTPGITGYAFTFG